MERAALLVPEYLRGATIAGPPLAEHLRTSCLEAGLAATVEAADTPRGEGPLVIVDGRFPAVSAASIWKLANALREEGAVLLAPDGAVLGVALRGGDPNRSLRDALHGSHHAAAIVVDADEAVLAEDAWSLAIAERTVRERHIADLARTGVRFVDHWRTVVETTVRIAPGCTIWPDVVLRGATVLEEGSTVQAGAWLADTRVGSRAVVKPHSVCEGAIIGADCVVGPMAHLRAGTVLEAEVKIGNFVEVKATQLGRGAKASHLTYLGDATIGAGANVGAGTITCNYDGFGKHRTEVGAGAFIGSNTALVAPVSVGAGAIVGAGSVITKDVPADALSFERAEQRILAGRAPLLNEKNRRRAAERTEG